MSYTDQENQVVAHPATGDEPISAEVQANTNKEATKSLKAPLGEGYRVDNEGNVNNYAIEPKMYKAEYPSSKQQRRYIFLGIAAILFVSLAIWIAFAVS